jgi:hypothetical protein
MCEDMHLTIVSHYQSETAYMHNFIIHIIINAGPNRMG